MDLQGERRIPASVEETWNALNDPETLKSCIAGCESLELAGDNEYLAVLGLKIGPVNAKFKGRLLLLDIVPMASYRILFEGQGGVAGFGKGHAEVRLSFDGDATTLKYDAQAQVGGKIAQIGSRLVKSAAAKLADGFFKSFEAKMEGGNPGQEAGNPDPTRRTADPEGRDTQGREPGPEGRNPDPVA